ncbi:pyridoxamine 5'-phosphate oxidase family protein [Nocardiopsis sp. RSe5-2]|uniref:Pyridoxamine 5'-phosphate oxidase family protein n=1 Tax=Nocardiopsis endophytica TaxID=3018445 RepID=A0ABT4UEB1_9ACTN|nr:pyridoxamine 5'-phosphate oxidase family protein [Nocardiopsis endophytica]MDA2815296.1 pyridoxamine 5'-phosphate oxidase family protein [Nocardiopsis endophytica]
MTPGPAAERPHLPADYQGADPDGADGTALLPWEAAQARLAGARTYWVVTSSGDGRPLARPFWGLWSGEGFLFATHPATRTARNLEENPRIQVNLEDGEEVLAVEGRAEQVGEEAYIDDWLEKYAALGARRPAEDEEVDRVVYRVRPRRAYGWSLAAFPTDLTRWTFPTGNTD